jgi:hypothetical protein
VDQQVKTTVLRNYFPRFYLGFSAIVNFVVYEINRAWFSSHVVASRQRKTRPPNQMPPIIKICQVASQFKVGDIIENFGAICRVVAIDAQRGLLVTIIADGGKGQRYYANPSLCKLQGEIATHREGIIAIA